MKILLKIKLNNLKILYHVNKKNIYNFCNFRPYSSQAKIAQGYQPKDVEKDKYPKWAQDSKASTENIGPTFSMILPPPNITGNLHLGHALMATIQDVICRHKRKMGYNVKWIPGTDHAGIATQVVVEKKIQKEKGVSRHEMGRDKFLNEVWKWKQEKGDSIIDDLKRLGCSLNWSDEYFTMDERQIVAVNESFVRLFDEGLIYRKNSLVNWSCSLESAISDIEVDALEITGPTELSLPGYEKTIMFGQLYDFSYKIVGEEKEEIVVSTTRPETLLGDVAVAVNPYDERYYKYRQHSTFLWHPLRRKPIPLIFDDSVDKEFGTGAVKITPAHDKNDFEIAKRHCLDTVEVFTEKGTIRSEFKEFSGLSRFDARTKLIEYLATQNLLREIRPHKMILPLCSRSKDVIEYILRPQWFMSCQQMANDAVQAVSSGRIRIHPNNFESEWYKWLNDCRDWCISRQLWWGHRIPVYLAKTYNKQIWVAATSENEALEKATKQLNVDSNIISIERDPDVLDTWFSSSLLPFSVFNWPQEEYKESYPLHVMETGHDIIFFWVARMVMLGLKLTNDVPFRNIVLNGIICDAHGRKMSKSLGNVVSPKQVIYGTSFESMQEEINKSHKLGILGLDELEKSLRGLQKLFPSGIQECGADALRFTLCSHNFKNHFINFDVAECYTNKLFFNKIWQATRYTLGACDKVGLTPQEMSIDDLDLTLMDKWILSRLSDTLNVCSNSFEGFNFHTAVAALKNFFYSNFCDVYLETTKSGIAAGKNIARSHCATLLMCLSVGLDAMSPITPFIAEELKQHLPECSKFNVTLYRNEELEAEFNEVLEICQSIRQLKSRNKISKKHEPKIQLFPQNECAYTTLSKYLGEIKSLTLTNEVNISLSSPAKENFVLFSTAGHMCSFGISTNSEYTPLKTDEIDVNQKKLRKLQTELAKYLERTSNEGFRKSASEAVQKKNFEKIQQLEIEIRNIKAIKS